MERPMMTLLLSMLAFGFGYVLLTPIGWIAAVLVVLWAMTV